MIRPLKDDELQQFNQVVSHPLQTWEWGEFKKQMGQAVERVGFFSNGKLAKTLQVTFHEIPILGGTAGYLPKSFMPDEEQLETLRQLGEKHRATFIKIEPNIAHPANSSSAFDTIISFLNNNGAQAGRPLFTRYTFIIDLTKSESELLESMSQKTRYNVNLAQKKGVKIVENSTNEGMETHLKILAETTKRQGFYAHSPNYFQTLWKVMQSGGMLKIFEARYQNDVVASWIVFILNGVLYYPYGASTTKHRDVMANNLLLWELIRFGKSQGCHSFDLWGALGPEEKSSHPWYGFHRFKAGYGGTLMEYLGSFDLVLQPTQYKIFRVAESARWKWLRLRAKLKL